MIIDKSAIIQHTKHVVNKIISPDANQSADAYMFFYRAYGITDIYKNRRAGIYLHYDDSESAPAENPDNITQTPNGNEEEGS